MERQGDMAACLRGRVATWQPPCGMDADDCTECPRSVATAVDFVATLGGDGTLLWACKTMGTEPVPPIVPFAMGSLGFMTPFSSASLPHVMEVRNHCPSDPLRRRAVSAHVRGSKVVNCTLRNAGSRDGEQS